MTRTEAFLARLNAGQTFLADGATGTMLQEQGLETGRIPEAWLFERPEQILALHDGYIRAGSDIILTCSFGGTRFRLEADGLADRVVEVNRRAAGLALQAAGTAVFVAGDLGPTGQLLAPLGTVTAEQVADAYAEQAQGLAVGGADLLILETMSDLAEAKAAIAGIRRVTALPLFCTFSFDSHGRTMMGVRPAQVVSEIGPLVQGLGANCGRDPAEFPSLMEALRRPSEPEAVLWAKPNAGLPRVEAEGVVYDATPEYMAQIALQLQRAGARIIGGCCGTTPAHIAAMAAALKSPGDSS